MKMIAFLLTLVAVSGCRNAADRSKYSLVAASDGFVYRVDGSSGEVWSIKQGLMSKVFEAPQIPLVIGGFYATEEGRVLKYVGKDKFESGRGLSDESVKASLRKKLGL